MTQARWHRVKELFQAVIEIPVAERDAFLTVAVDADLALRAEVESLLSADRSDEDFVSCLPFGLDFGAVGALASTRPATEPALPNGSTIGPYRVMGPVGAGSMGQVFRARDDRLDREVALKVLPQEFQLDRDRRARLAREAQALAALNHPHIAAIYGLEEANGRQALVLELVEGLTLADRIARGALAVREALEIARQLAEALEAAHERGIVHRDLKPANIKMTAAGFVKVLDFGLAKTASGDVASATRLESTDVGGTRAGVILGTPSYMSPEQARAQDVDSRADVWALGCVLFEMLAGGKAFFAEAPLDTIERVLNDEPDWRALPRATPARIRSLLRKCLEKDPVRRLQTIAEGGAVLESALAGEAQAVSRRYLAVATAVTVAVVSAGVYRWQRGARETATLPDWEQLTNLDSATQPALSPDGRMLTFVRGSGTFTTSGQIYVKALPNGELVRLTQDAFQKMGGVFSPSGDRIAYTVIDGSGWDTWVVPTLGGEPRRWLRNASGLAWVGANRLLFSEIKSDQHMAIVAADERRAASRDVYVPPQVLGMAHRSYPSPDGEWALVVEMDAAGVWMPCRLVPTDGSSKGRPMGPANARCTSAAWSPDGKWMYYSANAGDGFHIWRQRYPTGEPHQITSGPTEEEGIAVAPDGESLVTAVGFEHRSVWIHDASGERQVSGEGYAYWPLLSADARWLCFRRADASASGQTPSELWTVDLSSGRMERLFRDHLVSGYDVSLDNRVVAAVPDANGSSRLWIQPLDGSEPGRAVPRGEGDNPRWAKSDAIVFRSVTQSTPMLVRIRADGTGRHEVSSIRGSVLGSLSPDGQWVSVQQGTGTMLVHSTVDATVVRVLDGAISRLRWSPDGSHVYLSIQEVNASAFGAGRTYVLPLERGSALPPMPLEGFRNEADVAAVPGVKILPHGDLAPGPTPSVYAFSRTTTTRNLYRILLPP